MKIPDVDVYYSETLPKHLGLMTYHILSAEFYMRAWLKSNNLKHDHLRLFSEVVKKFKTESNLIDDSASKRLNRLRNAIAHGLIGVPGSDPPDHYPHLTHLDRGIKKFDQELTVEWMMDEIGFLRKLMVQLGKSVPILETWKPTNGDTLFGKLTP